MAIRIKDKIANAYQTIVEGAEKMARFVRGKAADMDSTKIGLASVKEHMDVIASCGTKIGVVDGLEGASIKLTKKDSPDGQHHFIPADWVDHVDNAVHLKKNSVDARHDWKNDAASCGCG